MRSLRSGWLEILKGRITGIVGLAEGSPQPMYPSPGYRTAHLTRDLRAIEEHFSRHRRREIPPPCGENRVNRQLDFRLYRHSEAIIGP